MGSDGNRRPAALVVAAAALGAAAIAALIVVGGIFDSRNDDSADAAFAASTVRTYCVDCHDAAVASGGAVIEPAKLAAIGAHAEIWEKVAHKLRAESMPPPDEPRPDEVTYRRVAAYLERHLDAAAEASPNAGSLPQLIRLTRTEYRNAIRDLVALEHLPAEMDYDVLLPADNASSGFDNIADLLFVSPVVMERYLDAARKVARLAVGDPHMPTMVNIHRMPLELPQDESVAGLPFGTRGGLHVDDYFPLDADYSFRIELAGAAREPHEIEITIDGERAASGKVGEGGARRAEVLEFTVPVTAGPHEVGVTFVRRTLALDESTVREKRRSRGTRPAIELVTIGGPHGAGSPGATPSRARIFVCRPGTVAEQAPCARRIVAELARRAYRRPVSDADVGALMPFYEAGRAQALEAGRSRAFEIEPSEVAAGGRTPSVDAGLADASVDAALADAAFDAGIQRVLERLLVSPQFLYRIERIPDDVQPGETFAVSALELASRLSFFLWSSLPDEELLALAEAGRLTEPAVLDAQVARMLGDARASALVDNFAAQWLFLRDLEQKDPDLFLFRDYDDGLREAFAKETTLFVESILREERSVLELLTADYTFVNERLAKHYGLPFVKGDGFQRVRLPADSHRGGLLGHGSILALTSYPTRTSPVLRGKYVLDNLLASPPPPPPPDVPSLEAEEPGERATTSLREAMAAHRANPQCASCHASMDPIGFAFEHFDAIGRWRDDEAGLPIEDASDLPDGTRVDGIEGVKRLLLDDPERFVGAVTEKLLMYALGRNVQYYDRPAIRRIVADARAEDYTFAALVRGIVSSVPFRMRRAPNETAPEALSENGVGLRSLTPISPAGDAAVVADTRSIED